MFRNRESIEHQKNFILVIVNESRNPNMLPEAFRQTVSFLFGHSSLISTYTYTIHKYSKGHSIEESGEHAV